MKWALSQRSTVRCASAFAFSFLMSVTSTQAHAGSAAEWTWTPSKPSADQAHNLKVVLAKPATHRGSSALTRALVIALADDCASTTPAATLASLAEVESGFDPLTIHDNTTGASYHPISSPEAVSLTQLLMGRRHDLDIGLVQINTRNLTRLRLSVLEAFSACQNLRAAGRLLNANYELALNARVGSSVLQTAYSIYNTGKLSAGLRNGYAEKVVSATRFAR